MDTPLLSYEPDVLDIEAASLWDCPAIQLNIDGLEVSKDFPAYRRKFSTTELLALKEAEHFAAFLPQIEAVKQAKDLTTTEFKADASRAEVLEWVRRRNEVAVDTHIMAICDDRDRAWRILAPYVRDIFLAPKPKLGRPLGRRNLHPKVKESGGNRFISDYYARHGQYPTTVQAASKFSLPNGEALRAWVRRKYGQGWRDYCHDVMNRLSI
jgi:hypothetical protein